MDIGLIVGILGAVGSVAGAYFAFDKKNNGSKINVEVNNDSVNGNPNINVNINEKERKLSNARKTTRPSRSNSLIVNDAVNKIDEMSLIFKKSVMPIASLSLLVLGFSIYSVNMGSDVFLRKYVDLLLKANSNSLSLVFGYSSIFLFSFFLTSLVFDRWMDGKLIRYLYIINALNSNKLNRMKRIFNNRGSNFFAAYSFPLRVINIANENLKIEKKNKSIETKNKNKSKRKPKLEFVSYESHFIKNIKFLFLIAIIVCNILYIYHYASNSLPQH